MNTKVVALVIVAVVAISGASAAFVMMNGNKRADSDVVAGMVLSSGAESFGYKDMGTYYLRGANLFQENLVYTDSDGTYKGLLAESWTTNSDASTWTFVIRDNVKWSDGEKFTADDVIFTISYLIEKEPWGLNDAGFLRELKTYKAKDVTESSKSYYKGTNTDGKETVTIEMAQPYSNLLLNMRCGLSILPQHIYKDVADPETYGNPNTEMNAAVGTGPFIVKSLDTTSRTLKLERNDNYYLGTPESKTFTIVYYGTWDVAALALQNKEIDLILNWGSGLSATAAEKLKADSSVKIGEELSAAAFGICFNNQKAPFNNKDMRIALSYAVNYEKLVEKILGGYGKVADKSIVPSSVANFKSNGKMVYDVATAKTQLQALGYYDRNADGWIDDPDGNKWQPTLAFNASSADIAAIVKESFNAAGIDLQLESAASGWAGFKKKVDGEGNRLYDMILSGCSHLGAYTWSGYVSTVVDKRASLADCQVTDSSFQAIITKINKASTDAELKSAAEELQDWYAANMPMIPFYEKSIITSTGSNVVGVSFDPSFGYTMCHKTMMEIHT